MTSDYDDGSGGGGIPWGDPSRNDYAKQLGEQVLQAQTDLLYTLNRGTFDKNDIPRIIRMIQKSELLGHANSQFAGLPTDQLEVLLFAYASNAQEGRRVSDYLHAITGFGMMQSRKVKGAAGKLAGFLGGSDE